MGKWKATGPDGLHIGFKLDNWDLVGKEVILSIKDMYSGQLSIERLNNTNIILLPKGKHQATLVKYKPISLYNTIYKILAKLLCSRLVQILPHLITENQCTFLKNRSPVDNAMIAHALIIISYLKNLYTLLSNLTLQRLSIP